MSLTGFRKTNRYESIEVEYFDKEFKKQKGKFTGFVAQIIEPVNNFVYSKFPLGNNE